MSVDQTWFGGAAQTGPSDSEKLKYYADNLAKAKAGTYVGREIKPGVELLPGWDPWGATGKTTGWEITSAIARTVNGDINSIVPGDWFQLEFQESSLLKTSRFVCNARDQYYVDGDPVNGVHHFTFVDDTFTDFGAPYDTGGSNDWNTSSMKQLMAKWLGDRPASLQEAVLDLNIPFTDSTGKRADQPSRVFPPSEYEAYGRSYQGLEAPTGTPPYAPFVILSRSDNDRIPDFTQQLGRSYSYDLRSAWKDNTLIVPVIGRDINGRPFTPPNGLNASLYPTSASSAKLFQRLCINIG